MTHLTAEQIEQLVSGPERRDEHLSTCPLCRQRLEEALAIQHRLRQAYDSVHADVILEHQIATSIRAAVRRQGLSRARVLLWRITPSLAAVAALILVAFSVTLYLMGPQRAQAAPAELAQIHQANLMPHAELHGSSDPAKVAEYLKKELGFVPALPKLGAGTELRGCCVAHFRNRPVGSYVLETDRGFVSIIVLPDKLDSLEFGGKTQYQGQTFHTGAFARCKMAAIEDNGYTYAAVGETDLPWLIELLQSLLTDRSEA